MTEIKREKYSKLPPHLNIILLFLSLFSFIKSNQDLHSRVLQENIPISNSSETNLEQNSPSLNEPLNITNAIILTLSEKANNNKFELFSKDIPNNIINKILLLKESNKEIKEKEGKYLISEGKEDDQILIVFSNFIEDTSELFKSCNYIKNVNFHNFNFGKIKTMREMFAECDYLTNVTFGIINAPKLKDVSSLFENCEKLISVQLNGYFKALLLENMSKMFKGCSSLEKIDLSKFKTKVISDMSEMFANCANLETVDFSNFVASKKFTMEKTFENCNKLRNVFMDNFYISYMCDCEFSGMFEGISEADKIVISTEKAVLPYSFLNILYYSDISVVGTQNYTDTNQYENENNEGNSEGYDDNGMDEGQENMFDNIAKNNTMGDNGGKSTIKKKKKSGMAIFGIIVALVLGLIVLVYSMIALYRCQRGDGEYAIPAKFSSSL